MARLTTAIPRKAIMRRVMKSWKVYEIPQKSQLFCFVSPNGLSIMTDS